MTEKPTSAKPIVVNGVTFRCYRTGILRHAWRSDDGRLEARRRSSNADTFVAMVDGNYIRPTPQAMKAKRFRSLENAMRAAVDQSQYAL